MSKKTVDTAISSSTAKHMIFLQSLISGIGWAFGVTIGFVLISTLLAYLVKQLGGLPLIGDWIASIVDATLAQLSTRTPGLPQ